MYLGVIRRLFELNVIRKRERDNVLDAARAARYFMSAKENEMFDHAYANQRKEKIMSTQSTQVSRKK